MSKTPALISFSLLVLVFLCCIAVGETEGISVVREAHFVSPYQIEVQLYISGAPTLTETLTVFGIQEGYPTVWNYDGHYEEYYGEAALPPAESAGGNGANVIPRPGSIEFRWDAVPLFPMRLVYGLTVSTYTSDQEISGIFILKTPETEMYFTDSPMTSANTIGCLSLDPHLFDEAYQPGGTAWLQLYVESYCLEPVQGLTITQNLSAPWTLQQANLAYPGFEGPAPVVEHPETGGQAPLTFIWEESPVFPLVLTCAMNVPSSASGDVVVGAEAVYHLSGADITSAAQPVVLTEGDPLVEGEPASEGEGELPLWVLTGIVRNADTRLPLSGAVVRVLPDDREVVTNVFGTFSFPNLTPAPYTVTVTRTGFLPYTSGLIEDPFEFLNVLMVSTAAEGEREGEGEEGELEGEIEGEIAGEGEGEPIEGEIVEGELMEGEPVEGEEPDDEEDSACCRSSKPLSSKWFGDLFLMGMALLFVAGKRGR